MKLGISSTGNTMDSMVDPRFGRCSCFVVFDTDTKASTYVDNESRMASGGAGIAAAQEIVNQDVEVVLTGNVGPNAYNVLKNAEIKAYRCGNVAVEKAIQLFKESKLESISQSGPAHAGMGGGSRGGF